MVGGTWKNWRKPLLFTYKLSDMSKDLTLAGHAGTINAVDMNDKIIASGATDKLVILWNKSDGSKISTLEDHQVSQQT